MTAVYGFVDGLITSENPEDRVNCDVPAQRSCIVLAGGGTGGHLSPGLALAGELGRRIDHAEIVFIGTGRPVEERMIPPAGFKLHVMPSVKLPRSLVQLPLFPFRLYRAIRRARAFLRELNPAVVIGLGGYASFPAVHAAGRLGIPTVILEQNSVPGRANRRLSRAADEVYVQFERSREYFRRPERVHVLGNPLREGITRGNREDALRQFSLDPERKTLVVLGGSQGATRINDAVCDALDELAGPGTLQIIHQAGARDAETVRERHAASQVKSHVAAFIDDMAGVLAAADLIISRAGATTLAEIAAVGRAAILVPYPLAADDHQLLNAKTFEDAGAAVVVRDAELNAATVTTLVTGLMGDDERRGAMADAALSLARPDATRDVCDRIMKLLKK